MTGATDGDAPIEGPTANADATIRRPPSQTELPIAWFPLVVASIAILFLWVELCEREHLRAMELFDVEMEIRSLTDVVKMFQMREHRLPTDAEWPRFLFEGSENHPDPYVDTEWLCNGEVNDRWGNAFVYRRFKTGERDDFEIVSWGADGVPGGEGRDADTSSKRR